MKVTFLIGNGFDLRQGLKTAYRNFLNHYLKITKNDSGDVIRLKQNIRQEELLWSDFEFLLGEITKFYSIEDKESFLRGLKHMRHAMSAYLQNQSKKFKIKITRQRKELKHSLNCLFSQEGYMYPPKDILSVPHEVNYEFLVFNYNTILFDMLKKIKRREFARNRNKITSHIDVKQKLIHCTTKQGFILGVNDASQIKNKSFAKDSDICNALIKSNQRNIMYMSKDVLHYISDSDVVYVYGMSIGDTDKRCWEQVIQWLKKSNEKKLVISYYDKNITAIDLIDIQQIKERLIKKLFGFGLKEENYQQIEIIINPNIFNFTKRTRKNK